MDFQKDHFKPQPASRVVLAYTVRKGDTVLFEDGAELTVVGADFGDAQKLGFASLNGRTAAPWVFEFSDGGSATTHPRMLVRIKGLGVSCSS